MFTLWNERRGDSLVWAALDTKEGRTKQVQDIGRNFHPTGFPEMWPPGLQLLVKDQEGFYKRILASPKEKPKDTDIEIPQPNNSVIPYTVAHRY